MLPRSHIRIFRIAFVCLLLALLSGCDTPSPTDPTGKKCGGFPICGPASTPTIDDETFGIDAGIRRSVARLEADGVRNPVIVRPTVNYSRCQVCVFGRWIERQPSGAWVWAHGVTADDGKSITVATLKDSCELEGRRTTLDVCTIAWETENCMFIANDRRGWTR